MPRTAVSTFAFYWSIFANRRWKILELMKCNIVALIFPNSLIRNEAFCKYRLKKPHKQKTTPKTIQPHRSYLYRRAPLFSGRPS